MKKKWTKGEYTTTRFKLNKIKDLQFQNKCLKNNNDKQNVLEEFVDKYIK